MVGKNNRLQIDMIQQMRCPKCKENYSMDEEIRVCEVCLSDLKIEIVVIKSIYCFPNGNVAVCDENGKQIPFLQGMLKSEMVYK